MHASHALLTPSPHLLLWTFLFTMLFGSTAQAQSFQDASELLVASDPLEEGLFIFGVSTVDADNDGFVDIYHPSRLYLNQGDTLYVDALQALGIEEPSNSWGSIWGDADNDGYLDVFFEDLGSDHNFSASAQGILFHQANEAFGIQSSAAVQGSLWADFNSDGRLDLFVGSDFGKQFDSELFLNTDDQHFDEVGVQAGITAPVNLYGAAGADYDRDGDIDIYIAACSPDSVESINALFRNDGQAAFTEVALTGSTTMTGRAVSST